MTSAEVCYGTGRRKSSVARVWVRPGSGKFKVNDRSLDKFFGRETLKMISRIPLVLTETENKYDITVNVSGGGISGQAGAIKHGLARALNAINDEWHGKLRKAGLLTRDSREVERKKYGQKGARARFQFSKR
ncbi:MAG: 30S ribosomal protein S9 [Candidatus Schekmanbacteria bacterium]|nr:30S ribosomal protein S9 [Candidatus Schekmanbacteria bacterium]